MKQLITMCMMLLAVVSSARAMDVALGANEHWDTLHSAVIYSNDNIKNLINQHGELFGSSITIRIQGIKQKFRGESHALLYAFFSCMRALFHVQSSSSSSTCVQYDNERKIVEIEFFIRCTDANFALLVKAPHLQKFIYFPFPDFLMD